MLKSNRFIIILQNLSQTISNYLAVVEYSSFSTDAQHWLDFALAAKVFQKVSKDMFMIAWSSEN